MKVAVFAMKYCQCGKSPIYQGLRYCVLRCDQFTASGLGPGSRSIVVMPAVANQLGAAAGLLSNWFAVTVFLSTQEKGAQC